MSKITDIKSFLKIKESIGQKYNKTDQNTKKKTEKKKKVKKNPQKTVQLINIQKKKKRKK